MSFGCDVIVWVSSSNVMKLFRVNSSENGLFLVFRKNVLFNLSNVKFIVCNMFDMISCYDVIIVEVF